MYGRQGAVLLGFPAAVAAGPSGVSGKAGKWQPVDRGPVTLLWQAPSTLALPPRPQPTSAAQLPEEELKSKDVCSGFLPPLRSWFHSGRGYLVTF